MNKEQERIEMMIAERMKYLFNCTTGYKAEEHKDKVTITFEGGEEIQIGTFGWRFIDEGREILSEVIDDGFPATATELKTLATAYYTDRLAYEYESWAEGADFAPHTSEWNNYHYAGERLTTIEKILSPKQMLHAKHLAGAAFCRDNRIGDDLWKEFLGVATPAVPEPLVKETL